jgi:hypothetical protein
LWGGGGGGGGGWGWGVGLRLGLRLRLRLRLRLGMGLRLGLRLGFGFLHVLEVGREGEPLRRDRPARLLLELPRAELLEAEPAVAQGRGHVDVQEDVVLLIGVRWLLGLDLVEQLVVPGWGWGWAWAWG